MPLFGRTRAAQPEGAPLRLHLGCGQAPIAGWLNIDVQALPGVDQVLDVRDGLPFENVTSIFGEHFLEHLELEEGLACLAECRRVLSDEGILRLSTPNLDWVYATHYRLGKWPEEQEAISDCFGLNRAFHGWGHRFLYNRPVLFAALSAAGFSEMTLHRYGESDRPELTGLERHERSGDAPDLPHVLIVQASGRGARRPMSSELLEGYRQAIEAK
jgi:predicted SAM-dependent methyltransferase